MAPETERRPDDLSEREREALHQVELGVEHLHRAHGHLVSFHHSTGRAMDHLATAEDRLRECGYPDLADELRDQHLPSGVVTVDDRTDATAERWSYDVLEDFQEGFLERLVDFGDRVCARVADGLRHAAERKQEHDWKSRAQTE